MNQRCCFKKEDWGAKIELWHEKAFRCAIHILKQKTIPNTLRILDIGCGKGSVLRYFATNIKKELDVNNIEIYGIDVVNDFSMDIEKIGAKFYKCDVSFESLPFPNNYFDLILSFEVIEHLLVPENFLKEGHRVLKDNGIMIITSPNLRWWVNILLLILGFQPYIPDTGFYKNYGTFSEVEAQGHIRAYTLRAIKEILGSYRFEIIKIIGIEHPYETVNVWKKGVKVFDKLIAKLFPSLCYSLLVISQK